MVIWLLRVLKTQEGLALSAAFHSKPRNWFTDMNIINTTLWSRQLCSAAAAKPHAHLCYYAGGVAVMFKTRKLRRQVTGWNSASASSLVSSKLIMQIVLDPLSRFKKPCPLNGKRERV